MCVANCLLVITFKRRRLGNTAMPANAVMPANAAMP